MALYHDHKVKCGPIIVMLESTAVGCVTYYSVSEDETH